MDEPTIAVYEQRAAEWETLRAPRTTAHAADFGTSVRDLHPDGVIVDLGCGPGWYSDDLGPGPVVAIDAARAMLDLVPRHAPEAWRVQADLAALPIRPGVARGRVRLEVLRPPPAPCPPARARRPAPQPRSGRALVELVLFGGDMEHGEFDDDDFAGRRFSQWDRDRSGRRDRGRRLRDRAFRVGRSGWSSLQSAAVRERTLPDYVGADMRMLLVGLNPSIYSADAGVGFARPGNRFWPAAIGGRAWSPGTEIPVTRSTAHGIGMTDMVKRATVRADELTTARVPRRLRTTHADSSRGFNRRSCASSG